VSVQIRHRAGGIGATAHVNPKTGRATVRFDTSQPAVTPGQSAVFFQGPRVLGGGRISSVAR
jgi:tRNA-specific 2-thiouridylase